MKVVFVGPAKSGKTSLIRALVGQEFKDEYRATEGVDFEIMPESKIQLWDIAGDERYKPIGDVYMKSADLICVCVEDPEEAKPYLNFNPNIRHIIVVTKRDKIIEGYFAVSAKTGFRITELKCLLGITDKHAEDNQSIRQMMIEMMKEIKELKDEIKSIKTFLL